METTGYRNGANENLDLAQFEDRFESAAVEQRKYEEPPDGKYQVVVDRVELARSQTSGNLMLKWQLKILGPQCAGAAVYRSNVCKRPHSLAILRLPADRTLVFASPIEFRSHHERAPKRRKTKTKKPKR